MIVTNNTLTVSNSGDMSQATLSTNPINLDQKYGFSIHAVFTGTPTGTLKIQGSNDVGSDGIGTGVSNWSDIPGQTLAVAAAGNGMFNVDASYYKWARLFYTKAGGTGTLTARLNSKGV
jgi:hypothetical protein